MLKKSTKIINRIANIFDSDDPIIIQAYRGYASTERINLKGRVLENENIFNEKDQSRIRNLIDNLKRFESDEQEGVKLMVQVRNQTFEVMTDDEGYFEIDEVWDTALEPKENRWINSKMQLMDNLGVPDEVITAEGEVYFPSINAEYGIISDVDDTVLQTHATSLFRLKMIYATFFLDPYERLPMDGIQEIYKAFEKGSDGKKENPIFYVSNSPWNIYDNITTFLEVNEFPKGPVLLRDVGLSSAVKTKNSWGHKMNTISHILKTYPDLPFIMLGDTASKDADHYIDLANEFDGRVEAIYIRHTKNTANARRIAKLIESTSDINAVLVKSSDEIREHALIHGYMKG